MKKGMKKRKERRNKKRKQKGEGGGARWGKQRKSESYFKVKVDTIWTVQHAWACLNASAHSSQAQRHAQIVDPLRRPFWHLDHGSQRHVSLVCLYEV